MRILLAEDDNNIAIIVSLVLEKFGNHTVSVCADGEAALHTALSQTFDLIILDGMMPKLSGLQVAEAIRAAGTNRTPIIFLSAQSNDQDIQNFKRLGNGTITKPFDPQTICHRIDQILKASGANQP